MILSPGQYTRLADLFLDLSKASSVGVLVSPALQKGEVIGITSVIYLLLITIGGILISLYIQGRKEIFDDVFHSRSWHWY